MVSVLGNVGDSTSASPESSHSVALTDSSHAPLYPHGSDFHYVRAEAGSAFGFRNSQGTV